MMLEWVTPIIPFLNISIIHLEKVNANAWEDIYRKQGMIKGTLVFLQERTAGRLTSGGLSLLDTSLVPHFSLSSFTTIDLVTTLDLPETLLCNNLCSTGLLLDGFDV